MIRFNAPFILDNAYIDQLNRLGKRLYAVHFSLNQPVLADARVHLHTQEIESLIEGLQRVPAARKYLLANGRFQAAVHYKADGASAQVIENLERLMAEGVLHGVIFSDGYFLKALSDGAPRLADRLEAIPSVNFMIDAAPKLAAVMEMVGDSRFLPPSKISLDRSLNRCPGALRDLAALIRKRYAGMHIELLANEGCLNHCPLRSTHEALIAAANTGTTIDTFCLNRDLGCMRVLSERPHRILASPFIRPENVRHYADVADIIKICGRTLGGTFLSRVLTAYADGKYSGNLLDLLDAAHWMAQRWELPNSGLPENILQQLTACDQNCATCELCQKIFQQHARELPLHFAPFNSG